MSRTQDYTAEEVLDALRRTRGMVYLAAQLLNCTPKTVYNYIKRYATLRDEAENQTGLVTDTAQLRLIAAIYNNEQWAIKWWLATKGKDRGFVEAARIEHSGPDGGPMVTTTITLDEWKAKQDKARADAEALLEKVVDAKNKAG